MTLLVPRRYVQSVDCIDLEELYSSGKRSLLVDRDNTLVPRDSDRAPAAVRDWLARADEMGFRVCLVSNNWYRSQVEASARELGIAHVIWCAMKPAPFALWAGMRKLSASRKESVLIGDQLYTDVLASRLARIDSILVRPQTHVDMWYTYAFRFFERRALRDIPCEGGGESPR